MFSINTSSPDETIRLATCIAPFLQKGDTILLSGELGAGKTLFVSGILAFYDKEKDASSPTFTIVNQHDLTDDLNLFHFDVYKLESSDEFLAIGGDEFFSKGICLIEWGEKIKDVLPQKYLEIRIEKDATDENKRNFNFISNDDRLNNIINEILINWRNSK